MITTDVRKYPGYEDLFKTWLMEQMKKQSETFGTKIINDYITELILMRLPFEINTERKNFWLLCHNCNSCRGKMVRSSRRRRIPRVWSICLCNIRGFFQK